ncbi:hypothetical protein LTR05_001158 [Lithohypha guttulata]|uniref:Uncharacterized protein n=1 Tax=Lithohypha guttulata TaxID=1690604 RepID=A0AAN7T7I8_9EURO|nr:hypothetical protein LTR05_001158 [Lithohypha guttulata]
MNIRPHIPLSDELSVGQRMRSASRASTNDAESVGTDDNTAAGMAMNQEDSMYLTPATSPTITVPGEEETLSNELDNANLEDDGIKQSWQTRNGDNASSCQTTLAPLRSSHVEKEEAETMPHATEDFDHHDGGMDIDSPEAQSPKVSQQKALSSSPTSSRATPAQEALPYGLAKVDISLNRASKVPRWDFTDKRPTMKCPSSLFQPYSKYVGTQQSDRQTYNVEVTILTVDMAQSSISGYLMIRGLTPEHPKLQTFFTGQIVGGPNQRYSFKTTDPAWGANEKVDLQHWLRFPPWRQLTSHAKRDMSFEFPLDNEPWWTQDHIFMRWKEHFLVPDHKQSNIQGASFEGFYYICLNQKEGKISGVYFHKKSEKYQQLELTHVTKKGLGIFGTSPLIELR